MPRRPVLPGLTGPTFKGNIQIVISLRPLIHFVKEKVKEAKFDKPFCY